MAENKIQSLETELKKIKRQSYLFLVLILLGVASTIYFYYKMKEEQNKNEELIVELTDKNEEIDQKNKDLAQLIEENDTYTEKDSLIKVLTKISTHTGADISLGGLNSLEAPQIQQRIDEARKKVAAYDDKRRSVVSGIMSGSESRRVNARDDILRVYSDDEQLITDLYNVSKGKINSANSDSYYQIIYVLSELDKSMLSANKQLLEEMAEAGKVAGLNGPSTQAEIDKMLNSL